MNLTVIFDGECGVCTLTIRKLKKWDRRDVLTFRTCQSVSLSNVEGVSPKKCMKAVYAIADDGTIASGSDAAALILTAMVNNRWPYRIGRWPIIRQVLSFGYGIVASNRRKLPGEKPWCHQHPEDCNHRNPVKGITL